MSARSTLKAETRQRLLDSALLVLDEEGIVALTTVKVTERAGIAQSSFYVHFADMNDLLHQLIDDLTAERRHETRDTRREARSRPPDIERLRDTFRVPIAHNVAHARLFRLLLRSRSEPTPLGEWSRMAFEENRRTLVEDLHAGGMPRRTASDRRKAQMIAEGLMALTDAMSLGHLEGRYPNVEEIVDILVAFSFGYFPLLVENPLFAPDS